MKEDLTLKLFETKREFFLFLTLIMIAFGVNLFFSYRHYQAFNAEKFLHTKVDVLNQYQKVSKKGRAYYVLKCKSLDGGFTFITTNYEDIRDLKGRDIRIGLITDKIHFIDFLHTFYVPSFEIELLPYHDSLRESLQKEIEKQHTNPHLQELFSALFLATPISKTLREKVSTLGISHLIAISGYHLSFLFGLFYLLFAKPYQFFQDRYFPYRNRRFDLSILIIMILFWYVWLLDFTPSLIRSFVMLAFGFFLFHRHVRILSFEVLGVAVLFILALKPSLLFSVGFWFSVSGIFYIYLFLHYFKAYNKWLLLIFLNIWVYVAMMPIVHFIFPSFSFLQLLSPLLSLFFAIFYPIEMLLHLVGFGGLLDEMLLKLFALQAEVIEVKTPLWFLLFYLFVSLLAIFHKRFLFLLASILFGTILFIETMTEFDTIKKDHPREINPNSKKHDSGK